MNLSSQAPNLWTERYEALRRHFLEDRRLLASDPPGLTLLLRSGVARWMRRRVAETSFRPPAAVPELSSSTVAVGPEALTMLLAQMTLRHLPLAPNL